MKLAKGLKPFYIAFAYEALARTEMVAGNKAKMQEHLDKAYALTEKVKDEEDKQALMGDLEGMK